jgi:hypothetical protein
VQIIKGQIGIKEDGMESSGVKDCVYEEMEEEAGLCGGGRAVDEEDVGGGEWGQGGDAGGDGRGGAGADGGEQVGE